MEKFNKYIDKIIFTLIAISFIILILSCVLQVFTRFILNIAVNLIVAVINLIVIIYGFNVAYAVRTQLSPALRVSMSFVYGAAPFSALFILYYSLFNITKDYKNFIQEEGKND